MNARHGDYDYECHGSGYALQRRTDPRIAAVVHAALGPARTVLNVGAGAGSYEPLDRHVVAVEPSAAMRAQRPRELAPAVIATAEQLPFDDGAFDAAMAMITVHQWSNAAQGLRELRRVTQGPVVVMSFDEEGIERFWLTRYAPELLAAERPRYPPLSQIAELLGGDAEVRPVPIPNDCVDGFIEAFYARPERLLDPVVRRAQSAWGFIGADVQARAVDALRAELASGEWDRRYGALRSQPSFDGSLRLVVSRPAGRFVQAAP
ncbi:class I SAM-dependent methyltransferase [Sorangium sp. So ce117]|uniref:class I SAM-dependent methyltransferase n=1 Tax=Sorangium sp. So ce117 TaxID=3133277 RepID=UPI003F5E8BBD